MKSGRLIWRRIRQTFCACEALRFSGTGNFGRTGMSSSSSESFSSSSLTTLLSESSTLQVWGSLSLFEKSASEILLPGMIFIFSFSVILWQPSHGGHSVYGVRRQRQRSRSLLLRQRFLQDILEDVVAPCRD